MNNCEFEEYLADFVANELPAAESQALEIHLQTCAACAAKVAELKQVSTTLFTRERTAPPLVLQAEYEHNLEQLFAPVRPKTSVFEHVAAALQFLLATRIRLAAGLAFLLAGIAIGYFSQSPVKQQIVISEPKMLVVPGFADETQVINRFITESEIVLLSLTNFESVENIELSEIRQYKNQAEKMVRRMSQVLDYVVLQNDPRLNRFMIDLEVVLLEIANLEEKNFQQKIREISEIVHQRNIFRQVQTIRAGLQPPKSNTI